MNEFNGISIYIKNIIYIILILILFIGTHSFGIITLSYEDWIMSDEAHRIGLLAKNFARQWFGGVTTISKYSQFCFQVN